MTGLEFKIRLVTPAFAGGGDDVVLDEERRRRRIGPDGDGLRVPSLRGLLRFWLRAKEDPRDFKAVFAKEARIFGSADSGQGLRIRPVAQDDWEPATVSPNTAKTYLGFGAVNNRKLLREAIPENKAFTFFASGTKVQIEELRKCLILLHLFGGIGARSRRGWGSVQVVANFIPPLPAREDGLADWFGKLFRAVWSGSDNPSQIVNQPVYSAFSGGSGVRRTRVLTGDYSRIFEEFYSRFREVRLSSSPSQLVKDDLKWEREDAEWEEDDGSPAALQYVPQRLAYGLPYSPKAKNGRWAIEYQGRPPDSSGMDKRQWTTRRASPLFLKIHRFAPNRHFGIALHLDAQFFGDLSLQIGAKDKPNTQPPPGPAAIQAFLNNPSWTRIALP